LTAIERLKLELPPLLLPVTTKVAAAEAWLGVPVICPLVVLSVRPAGNAGTTEYCVGVPPETVGDSVAIATSVVNSWLAGAYEITGAGGVEGGGGGVGLPLSPPPPHAERSKRDPINAAAFFMVRI
jgi:hypothetical protein